MLSGHKHVPFVWLLNDLLVVNSGTVSSHRLRGYVRPSYNLLEVTRDRIVVTLRYPGTGERHAAELDRRARCASTPTPTWPGCSPSRPGTPRPERRTVFVRLFSSAIDPSDLAEVRRIFAEDIAPVFESLPGCLSMELLLGTDRNAGGLVDAAALSRWNSQDDLTARHRVPGGGRVDGADPARSSSSSRSSACSRFRANDPAR